MVKLNINADLGENAGQDEQIMPYLSSCNIATGGHIGDDHSIEKAIKLAKEHNVKIGAHPSYPDQENFGRIKLVISDEELLKSLVDQLRSFYRIAAENNVNVHHIKPHGALYHDLVYNERKAKLFLTALDELSIKTSIYTLKSGFLHQLGQKKHKIHFEAFIDRRYETNSNLVSRKHPKALILEKEEVWKQLYEIVFLNKITVISGEQFEISAGTFCIHGDHPNAAAILEYIHQQLERIKP